MNQGKYVFSQVASFLPVRVFDRCVARHGGNKWIKHFSCKRQLLCMMFGQLSNRRSMRDLLTCISAHSPKYYHLGFGRNVSRANLQNANEKRDWRIYEEFATALIKEARQCCVPERDLSLDTTGNIYAFDSTTIDLCLNVYYWATFRTTKAAIKLHTLYDVRTSIPSFVLVTPASVHDVNAMDQLVYEAGAYYILDRAYLDCKRLYELHNNKSFFVTRAKHNIRFTIIASEIPDRAAGILFDQRVRFSHFYSSKDYPEMLRRIGFYDDKEKRSFVFLTNDCDLPAEQIALLYKYRWSVELFFKWIKQHLQIESFWGTTENAVKTQVYIAIATYTLVAIIRSKLNIQRSTYEILQILGVSLFDKTPLRELLEPKPMTSDTEEIQFGLEFARI